MANIKDLFIFTLHNFLIAGVTNCGKTHFVLSLLETVYKGHFENIVIFCTTFDYNKTYDRTWILKDKNVIILNPGLVISYCGYVSRFTKVVTCCLYLMTVRIWQMLNRKKVNYVTSHLAAGITG